MCIDLHTHSIHSDGSCTPRELVQLAVSKGLSALALTDHDIMEGVEELLEHGHAMGLRTIPGVEVSALLKGVSVHIIGYGIDHKNSALIQWLARLQEGRDQRNHKIINSLQDLGIDISDSDLNRVSQTGLTGRPHIANILMEKGVVRSFNEAFNTYLGRGKKAWHCRFCYSALETIQSIHNAGGVAVLAHPGNLDPSFKTLPQLVSDLNANGLDGIEVYYPSHSAKMKKSLKALADTLGMITTGGSDFHGETRPTNTMIYRGGPLCPPETILDDLNKRLLRYN